MSYNSQLELPLDKILYSIENMQCPSCIVPQNSKSPKYCMSSNLISSFTHFFANFVYRKYSISSPVPNKTPVPISTPPPWALNLNKSPSLIRAHGVLLGEIYIEPLFFVKFEFLLLILNKLTVL